MEHISINLNHITMEAGIYEVVKVKAAKKSFKLVVKGVNNVETIIKGIDIARSLITKDYDESTLPSRLRDVQGKVFSDQFVEGMDFEFPEYLHILGIVEGCIILTNYIQ